jgi:ABC-type Mn2+/Zn2+ transport system permease subunit
MAIILQAFASTHSNALLVGALLVVIMCLIGITLVVRKFASRREAGSRHKS